MNRYDDLSRSALVCVSVLILVIAY